MKHYTPSIIWPCQSYRWPNLAKNALTVYGRDADITQKVVQAINQWLMHLSVLPAVLTANPPYHIEVQRQAKPPRPYVVGQSIPRFSPKGLLQGVQIVIYENVVIDNTLNLKARENRLSATLLHEAGHALGLDHHPEISAVMHRYGWRNTELHPVDIMALQKLYKSHL